MSRYPILSMGRLYRDGLFKRKSKGWLANIDAAYMSAANGNISNDPTQKFMSNAEARFNFLEVYWCCAKLGWPIEQAAVDTGLLTWSLSEDQTIIWNSILDQFDYEGLLARRMIKDRNELLKAAVAWGLVKAGYRPRPEATVSGLKIMLVAAAILLAGLLRGGNAWAYPREPFTALSMASVAGLPRV